MSLDSNSAVATSSAVVAPRVKPAPVEKSTEPSEREQILDIFHPSKLKWRDLDYFVLGWTVMFHIGAVAALFFITWQAVAVFFFLHWLTCSIGICLGYHRYLSHKSLKLRAPAEFFTLMCGTLSGQGSVFDWAANHRLHHQQSDHKGDPHSPLENPWWSHILWLFVKVSPHQQQLLWKRYVPELLDRKLLRFFVKTEFLWQVAMGVSLFLLGGWPMLLWGLCMRLVVAYHSTWFVNSATHLWGYRNYETRDESRNLWWVALLSYGEGWHNNHHAHPSLAPAGHRWWEIDMTWWFIKGLKAVGLAYDVRDKVPTRGDTSSTEDTVTDTVRAGTPAAEQVA